MDKKRILLSAGVALLLVAPLGALVVKTRAVDFDKHNEIISTLRQLKQVDAEWNVDVLKSKTGFNSDYDPVANPLPLIAALEVALHEKSEKVWGDAASLTRLLEQFGKTMDQKVVMIDRFKSQNSILRNSSRYLPVSGADTIEAVRTSALPAEDKTDLEQKLSSVLTHTMNYNLNPDAALKTSVAEQSSELAIRIQSLPPELKERVETFIAHAAMILRQQEVGDSLLAQLASLPTAKKIDELSDTYQLQHEQTIVSQQVYRHLLIGYSVFLLLLIGYFGWRLAKSYSDLNRSNADLNAAYGQLKESQMALVQSEKMSALGQMVAGIAHEINTPLAYVKGTLGVLAEQLHPIRSLAKNTFHLTQLIKQQNADKQTTNAQFAKVSKLCAEVEEHNTLDELGTLLKDGLHGIDQISEIVLNLKNFSRLDRAKVSEFSVHEGLESTLLLAKNLLKNTVEIRKEFEAVPKIKCSPSQINQVFLNIITNAVHAMPEGRTERGVITLRTAREGNDMVRVEIQDNGSGIPKDVLPKIFDPFYTTKEIGKGTGMGLSISFKIIQEHGGKILVDTEEGMGTVFSILLPVQTAQEEQQQPAVIHESELVIA